MRILFLIVTLFAMTFSSYGQELDSVQKLLFNNFVKVFENEHFAIQDRVQQKVIHDEALYFLFKIVPKKEGNYFIKQVFEHKPGWGYKKNSILNVVKAVKKGTPRFFSGIEPSPFNSPTCWVGDTIVIPIFWNKNIVTSDFSKGEKTEREIYGKMDTVSTYNNRDRQLNWKITNMVNEVKVEGVSSSYAVHRHLKDETVSHNIRLKAIQPGKFILKIGAVRHKLMIYPKDRNITKTVTQVIGLQWEGKTTSYALPPGYSKSHFVPYGKLRVGDTIAFTFLSYVQAVNNPQNIDPTIIVQKLAFDE
ncbi:hypothetical protein [Costertonia aggregata]|uniref:Uncharacterized protein n=1 Tax=Costertonia aggregata TaxID=343403 RepID=A0A7H9AUV3_9FLAO|nr:hypothetical protein [Costertonia aggregata]QLG46975.1 hypothetical protein HYG79_16975 [Costertonia aggregata]